MTDNELAEFIAENPLLSICRERIDDRSLQGFLVSFSATLLWIRYVRDFRLDGDLILRREDISSMESRKRDQFQLQLMRDEGTVPFPPCGGPYDLESFGTVLDSLPDKEVAIFEEELEGLFFMGRYAGCDQDNFVKIHEFTGTGRWREELTTMGVEEITCCQFRTDYIRPYQNHHDQNGFPEIPDA